MDATLKKKIANAWRMLERTMQGSKISWSDVGNWIEEGDALKSLNQIMRNRGVSPDDVMNWIKGGGEDDFRAIYDAGLQEGIKRGVEQEKKQQQQRQRSYDASGSFGDGGVLSATCWSIER
jgi:hypothetical protein